MTPFEKTLSLEGGYSYDADDPGGETRFGISKRSYPKLDIKNLTREDAMLIYKKDYWDAMHCDQYKNKQYAWKIFDIAFNQGQGTAMAFIKNVEHPDTTEGVYELVKMCALRYANLVNKNPKNSKFINGWMKRAFEMGGEIV